MATSSSSSARDALKEFYSVIKKTEGMQRFAFITGISKFSKVSIFSDLNNQNDMAMVKSMSTLFCYTHDEVKRFLPGLRRTCPLVRRLPIPPLGGEGD